MLAGRSLLAGGVCWCVILVATVVISKACMICTGRKWLLDESQPGINRVGGYRSAGSAL